MKKISLAFSFFFLFFIIAFFSCKKINEATELGGNLIPPVDNVHTFETALDARTNNLLFHQKDSLGFFDQVAIGHIANDPEFGTTHANAYFTIGRQAYGTSPFFADRNAVTIDSVILSLAYNSGYGDTVSGSPLTFRVFEIAGGASTINDTSFYKFEGTPDFATTGGELGSKTFTHRSLKDSVDVIRPGDTSKVVNVLRIPLTNSLGTRFKNFDSTLEYKNDSAFKEAFRGFAIKADNSGNSLGYFSLFDNTNTKLTIYYRAPVNGKDSLASTVFYHTYIAPSLIYHSPANYRNGQADVITRTYAGNAAATLNNGLDNDDKLYIQSEPGTYASIRIPALDTFQNKVIHLAEIIATPLDVPGNSPFSPPPQLMLDRMNKTGDTAFILQNDLVAAADGSLGFNLFGGILRRDQTYRFNVSRYVQGIITRHEPNDTLRLYAPYRTNVFSSTFNQAITVPANSRIAEGRVVLAGGNYPDPKLRLRLRIIYSNL